MPKSPLPKPAPFRVNGFLICRHGTNEPVQFIDCDAPQGTRTRDRVESGLLFKVDWERFYVLDLGVRDDGE